MRSYRRRGVAKELILGVARQHREVGGIFLTCIEQTGNAEVFSRMGFSGVSRATSPRFELIDGTGATEVEMVLKLN